MTAPASAQGLILRGGGSAAFGYLIRFGARLLFIFFAARLFGAVLFGAYSLAIASVELAAAIGLLGMKRLLFKFLDEPSDRSPAHLVLDAALLVTLVSLALAAAIALFVLTLPGDAIAANSRLALLLVAPMVVGQALIDLFLTATRWKARMRYEVFGRSLVEPYAAIVALLAAYAAGFEETGLLVSYWAGTLAALVYAIFGFRLCFGGLRLERYALHFETLRSMFRTSILPTTTDLAAAAFARLDLYLVGFLVGEAPAGIYAMARQVRTPVRQVRQSFDGMLTPVLARTLATRGPVETGAAAAAASRLILAVQLPVLIGLAAIGEPLLGWLGAEFLAGYYAMVILAAAETILGAFGVGDLILLYRRPSATLWITGLSLAVNLVLAAMLIGPMGITGAALAVLLAVAFAAIRRRHLLRSAFGIAIPLSYNLGPLAASAAAVTAGLATGLLLARTPAPFVDLAILAATLATYGAALALWMRGSRQSLLLSELRA